MSTFKKNGYLIYNSMIIPNYTFVKIDINDFDNNLYEKKIITQNDIEITFNNEKFILKSGTHYFPILCNKHMLLTNDKNIEVFKINKPNELVVSKIYKEKQIIIDKFLNDDNDTKSLSSLFNFYHLFIPNITHFKYNYLFSMYNEELTFSKYLQLNNSIKDSILYQIYNQPNYKENRINTIEYKGKIKNIINDESIVENILTSLNNNKIIEDPYINIHLIYHKFENDNCNFLKIKYLNKDHIILRKKLKDEYMIILRPPKYDEYIDLYEPYSEDIIQEMWKSHFDIINNFEKKGLITFCEV